MYILVFCIWIAKICVQILIYFVDICSNFVSHHFCDINVMSIVRLTQPFFVVSMWIVFTIFQFPPFCLFNLLFTLSNLRFTIIAYYRLVRHIIAIRSIHLLHLFIHCHHYITSTMFWIWIFFLYSILYLFDRSKLLSTSIWLVCCVQLTNGSRNHTRMRLPIIDIGLSCWPTWPNWK